MAKKNTKEKLTYKQMVSYMDFLNAKMTRKFEEIDTIISGLGYYLKAYVQFSKDDEKFKKFLDKKQKEAEKELKKIGSDAPAKSEKDENS
jgi:hypothetical protein